MWCRVFKPFILTLVFACYIGIATAMTPNFEGCLLQEFRDKLLKHESYQSLTQKQAKFLLDHMLPVAGKRVVQKTEKTLHVCSIGTTCLDLPHFAASKDLRVEWVSREQGPGLVRPEILVTDQSRTLRIPENFDLSSSPNGGQDLIQSFLMGHPLHPYIDVGAPREGWIHPAAERLALGEPGLVLKSAQKEGILAATRAIDRGDKSFVFVASTGLGKTEVLMSVLMKKLQASSSQKLHILVVDQTSIVNQLTADAMKLQKQTGFKLIQWGGKEKADSIESLASDGLHSKEPVVLVTTIQSLKAKMGKPGSEAFEHNSAILRKTLGSILFDEVHHAGATEAREVIQSLIHHADSHAFFFGTSATPIHRDVPLIESLFGGKAFYANIDTAESYLTRSGSVERSIDEVVDQLATSIRRGELTPVSQFDLIDPKEFTAGKNDLFVRAGDHATARYVLNEEHDLALAAELKDRFLAHRKGFIATAEIDEAERIAEVFNRQVPGRKFAALHSKMNADEVLERFRKGEINYLVTVKKLDEGVNLPDMSLYVDLNRNVGPRQILQRIGRVLRLYHNKESSEVVALFNINEQEIREKLVLLDRILKGDFASGWEATRSTRPWTRSRRAQSSDARIRGLQARLTELSKRVERSGADPKWSPEVVAEDLIDFYLEHTRLPGTEDGDIYVRLHKLKESPVLMSRLSELPELQQAVAALGPRKTRLSLGKRGPLPAADVLNGFVEETLQKEGIARLPDPKRQGLSENEKRREAAILRWIANYRGHPEFDQNLNAQAQELLSREAISIKPRKAPFAKSEKKRIESPVESADLVNEFFDNLFFDESEIRLPSSSDPDESYVASLIEKYRTHPEFRGKLSVDAKRLIYGEEIKPSVEQEVSKEKPPIDRRVLSRQEVKAAKQQDYERRLAERAQREKLLDEARKGKMKTALELASSKSDLDSSSLHLLEWARSELKRQGRHTESELVSQRIGRELEKKRVRMKNVSANKLTEAEEKAIRENVSFVGKASDDWGSLPLALRELFQKRVLVRVAEDPVKAGLMLDWGKTARKTWSAKLNYQGKEYRLIYSIRAGKAEILMVGLKDLVIQSIASRVERYFSP
jgi:superfamily II DNA or RNA helicase